MSDEKQLFVYNTVHNKAQTYKYNSIIRDVVPQRIQYELHSNNKIDSNSVLIGQSYDDNTDDGSKKSNIDYLLIKGGFESTVFNSSDGSFAFESLIDGKEYTIIAKDSEGLYNGKAITTTPKIDYQKAINCTCIYFVGEEAWFKIKFFGDPTMLSVSSNIGQIERVDSNNYNLTNTSKPLTISVHDYIDGVLVMKDFNY